MPIQKITNETPLDSREFKIFLRMDNPNGFREFWEIAKKTAEKLGGGITESHKPFHERQRDVYFLDTPDFALNRAGFLLRKRVRYDLGQPLPNYELTFKFRDHDYATVAKADTHSAIKNVRKEKLEEDVNFISGRKGTRHHIATHNTDDVHEVFSMDTTVLLETNLAGTIKDYSRIFPGLSKIGLLPQTPLTIVNKLIIDERKISPGIFEPGRGPIGEISISAWYEKTTKTPLLAEFSCKREIKKGEHHLHLFKKFFEKLSAETPTFLARCTTKSAFIYSGRW